jgi:sialic acid synthase SpsE
MKAMDDLVKFFSSRGIPFAVNHCVSIYPSEDYELELNQIDYMRQRYPLTTIGFSTHEYRSWDASMLIAYAKGARTFERHIDLVGDGIPASLYCSQAHQIDAWFKSFKKAKEMCGDSGQERRFVSEKETRYLDALVRGVYARRDLPAGYVLHHSRMDEDFYLAVPLQKGQLSCRETMNGERINKAVSKDKPLTIDHIDSPHTRIDILRQTILERGL